VATLAIADEVSASDPATLTNDDVAAIAGRLKDALRTCNARGLTCDVVDLRYSSDARLRRYRTIVVPPFVRPPQPLIAARLTRLAAAHVAVASYVPPQRGSGITVLAGPDATFGIAVNWTNAPRRFGGRTWTGTGTFDVPPFTVAARDARIIVIAGQASTVAKPPPFPQRERVRTRAYNLNAEQAVNVDVPPVPAGKAVAVRGSAFGSGERTVTLANARVVAVFVPDGGGRLVVFAPRGGGNATNATGALRDDVLVQPPPSATDRIAKYTHSYPAGTYNRTYRTDIVASGNAEAVVRFRYDAPDLGGGAHFERTVRLAAGSSRLIVDERVRFDGADPAQRAVTRSALAVAPAAGVATAPSFVATAGGRPFALTWSPQAVQSATWTRFGSNGTLSLVFAGDALRTTYAIGNAGDQAAVQAFAQRERDWIAANPNPPKAPGEVAKW
jgi:hypothetical protein